MAALTSEMPWMFQCNSVFTVIRDTSLFCCSCEIHADHGVVLLFFMEPWILVIKVDRPCWLGLQTVCIVCIFQHFSVLLTFSRLSRELLSTATWNACMLVHTYCSWRRFVSEMNSSSEKKPTLGSLAGIWMHSIGRWSNDENSEVVIKHEPWIQPNRGDMQRIGRMFNFYCMDVFQGKWVAQMFSFHVASEHENQFGESNEVVEGEICGHSIDISIKCVTSMWL